MSFRVVKSAVFAGLLGVAAMLAGPATANEPVKIRLGDLAQSINGIASGVMVQQGFDKKHGVSVEYQVFPTLDGLFTAIRGKQIDIGFGGWTAFAAFRANGLPITTVFPVGRGTSLDVLVPVDSPVKSLADLKGRKIGSFAGAAGNATVLLRVLTSQYFGYDPGKTGDLQYAGPGLLPTMAEKGDIAAALLFDPLAARAIASGKFRSVANLSAMYREKTGEDFLWIGYATNDEFTARHPKAVEGFTRAWIESVNYVRNNPEVFEAYGKQLNLDQKTIDLLRQRVTADYTFAWTDKDINNLRSFARRANEVMGSGYLDNMPDAAFSNKFVPR